MVTDQMIQLAAHCTILFLAGVAGWLAGGRRADLGWLLVAVLFYAAYDAALTRGFGSVAIFDFDWNWVGKVLALSLSVAIAIALGRERAGLCWGRSFDKPALAVTLAVGIVATALSFAVLNGGNGFDIETLAFQWTMPGFDEELFYRGVLLLALNEAFRARAHCAGASIGYGGVLTCLVFGLAHALTYDDGAFAFDALTMAVTGVPAVVLLWLRERTGSVVLPIVAHNFANGIPTLIGMT